MIRRAARPAPSGFSIALPAKQSIAVENKKESDVAEKLVVNADDSLVSPMFATQQFDATKFFHVEQTNLYVFMEGVSVFQDSDPLPDLMETPTGKEVATFESSEITAAGRVREGSEGMMVNHRNPSGDNLMTMVSSQSSLHSMEGGAQDPSLEDALREVQTRSANSDTSCMEEGSATAAPSSATSVASSTSPFLFSSPVGTKGGGSAHHRSSLRRCPALDMSALHRVAMVGKGQQGVVHSVRVANDQTLRALKTIEVREATKATSDVERQGRKMGIVRELNMVKSLRSRPSDHLMNMYDAVYANEELYILMELLSTSVDHIQRYASRLPPSEIHQSCQTVFRKHLGGSVEMSTAKKDKVFLSSSTKKALQSVPRQTPLPEIILSMMANDVLLGLHELHTVHGKVHCDLKPENIMMSSGKEKFKLADFGCTVNLGSDGMVTQRGVGLGSKMYKAPEQLGVDPFDDHEKVRFDAKADIWALGIVLLELANGCHPTELFKTDFWNFASKLRYETLIKPIASSVAFQEFVEACLSHDPIKRPSAQELLSFPFVQRFARVPRSMLTTWVTKLELDSNRFQNKIQREILRKSVLWAAHSVDKEKHTRASNEKWKVYNRRLNKMPVHNDPSLFPAL